MNEAFHIRKWKTEWRSTKLKLLSINFPVDLNEIFENNFIKKITVMKNSIIPKITTLPIALPPEKYIEELNK